MNLLIEAEVPFESATAMPRLEKVRVVVCARHEFDYTEPVILDTTSAQCDDCAASAIIAEWNKHDAKILKEW